MVSLIQFIKTKTWNIASLSLKHWGLLILPASYQRHKTYRSCFWSLRRQRKLLTRAWMCVAAFSLSFCPFLSSLACLALSRNSDLELWGTVNIVQPETQTLKHYSFWTTSNEGVSLTKQRNQTCYWYNNIVVFTKHLAYCDHILTIKSGRTYLSGPGRIHKWCLTFKDAWHWTSSLFCFPWKPRQRQQLNGHYWMQGDVTMKQELLAHRASSRFVCLLLPRRDLYHVSFFIFFITIALAVPKCRWQL